MRRVIAVIRWGAKVSRLTNVAFCYLNQAFYSGLVGLEPKANRS